MFELCPKINHPLKRSCVQILHSFGGQGGREKRGKRPPFIVCAASQTNFLFKLLISYPFCLLCTDRLLIVCPQAMILMNNATTTKNKCISATVSKFVHKLHEIYFLTDWHSLLLLQILADWRWWFDLHEQTSSSHEKAFSPHLDFQSQQLPCGNSIYLVCRKVSLQSVLLYSEKDTCELFR